jgi:hypothetical protein
MVAWVGADKADVAAWGAAVTEDREAAITRAGSKAAVGTRPNVQGEKNTNTEMACVRR